MTNYVKKMKTVAICSHDVEKVYSRVLLRNSHFVMLISLLEYCRSRIMIPTPIMRTTYYQ